jgi:hypothetical protein
MVPARCSRPSADRTSASRWAGAWSAAKRPNAEPTARPRSVPRRKSSNADASTTAASSTRAAELIARRVNGRLHSRVADARCHQPRHSFYPVGGCSLLQLEANCLLCEAGDVEISRMRRVCQVIRKIDVHACHAHSIHTTPRSARLSGSLHAQLPLLAAAVHRAEIALARGCGDVDGQHSLTGCAEYHVHLCGQIVEGPAARA